MAEKSRTPNFDKMACLILQGEVSTAREMWIKRNKLWFVLLSAYFVVGFVGGLVVG